MGSANNEAQNVEEEKKPIAVTANQRLRNKIKKTSAYWFSPGQQVPNVFRFSHPITGDPKHLMEFQDYSKKLALVQK